jgi:hypothetical protein
MRNTAVDTGMVYFVQNYFCLYLNISIPFISIPGEPGMCVGVINSSSVTRNFHGYTDQTANSKKILHNVFKKGDSVFLSGE